MPFKTEFAEERQNSILSLLKTKEKLLVSELCDLYDVSSATIRNDLNTLEKKGLLKRTHGGAIANLKIGFEETSVQKFNVSTQEKVHIAERAESFVEDGDIIAIDTGTTTYALAKMLSGKQNLTVVTTDLRIANLLEGYKGVSLIIAGGAVRKGFGCTTGALANNVLMQMNVDKVFMATNSVGLDGSLSTPDIEQAQIKKSLLKMGRQTFLLCDSTKFTASSFINFGNLNDIDCIITDTGIDPEIAERIKSSGWHIETV